MRSPQYLPAQPHSAALQVAQARLDRPVLGQPEQALAFNALRTDLEAVVTGNFKHQAFLGLFLSDAFLALLFLLQPEHERRTEASVFLLHRLRVCQGESRGSAAAAAGLGSPDYASHRQASGTQSWHYPANRPSNGVSRRRDSSLHRPWLHTTTSTTRKGAFNRVTLSLWQFLV